MLFRPPMYFLPLSEEEKQAAAVWSSGWRPGYYAGWSLSPEFPRLCETAEGRSCASAVLCKSLWPLFELLFSQGCIDNSYLFLSVFIKIQPENTGKMYTILKTQNVLNKMASKGQILYSV